MNYTDLNEDQKAEVRLVILGECSIPEDLVIDWKEILVEHWTDFPNGYWYAMVGCL